MNGIGVRWRLPVMAAGGLAMLGGLYAALILLELAPDTGSVAGTHGPVMTLGFVGTLVAMERAVALGARWALLAPAGSASGALAMLAGAPALAGHLLMSLGGAALLVIYAALWRRQPTVAVLAQAAGAFSWYAATLLWLGGFPTDRVIAWLAAFIVLTIAGERLELAHMNVLRPAPGSGRTAERWFIAATLALLAGAAATVLWPGPGYHLWGLALLGMTAWLCVFDVARGAIRGRGLPRYGAAGLLAGYAWLIVAGLLWAGGGPADSGSRYDATLHAVFLGFAVSMIFVHAPIILPAVLRRPLPYHPVLYAPLVLLHLSLAARLALGDLAGLVEVWRWSGVANEISLLGFAACAAVLGVRAARRPTRASARPTATSVPTAVGR